LSTVAWGDGVWWRGGLAFKAHRLVYHSTLGLRVIKQKKKKCGGVVEHHRRFRGGLVFKAHRLLYHSTLGLRVIKKKRREHDRCRV